MKKLIAIALCMLLLLSGCSLVGDAPGVSLQLRDLFLDSGDGGLDMRGLSASLDAAHSDSAVGLRLAVTADGRPASQAILAVADGCILIVLDGGMGEPYTYAIQDQETVLAIQETIGNLFAAGEELAGGDVDLESMTDEELEAYMAQLEEQLQSMGLGGEDALTDEDQQSMEVSMAQLERFSELLEQCVTEGAPMEHDGEMYETTSINISSEDVVEILDMLNLSEMVGENVALGQMLTDAGVSMEITGAIAVSEDGSKAAYGVSPTITTSDGDRCAMNMTLQQMSDDGSVDLYADLSLNGEDKGSFSINVNVLPLDEAGWLPDHVPADAQLIDLDDRASVDMFVEGASDFFGQLSGTLIGVSLGNGMIGALDSGE